MKPVYRNDTDRDVWVSVTAPDGASIHLDPSSDDPPLELPAEALHALLVEPGREVFADAKVTVEPIE